MAKQNVSVATLQKQNAVLKEQLAAMSGAVGEIKSAPRKTAGRLPKEVSATVDILKQYGLKGVEVQKDVVFRSNFQAAEKKAGTKVAYLVTYSSQQGNTKGIGFTMNASGKLWRLHKHAVQGTVTRQ